MNASAALIVFGIATAFVWVALMSQTPPGSSARWVQTAGLAVTCICIGVGLGLSAAGQ